MGFVITMGDPRKQRKKYHTPGHPWQKERLEEELKLVGRYGLRNKKEVWIHQTLLSKFRSNARDLLALSEDRREKQSNELLGRLFRIGLLEENAQLDDILTLSFSDIADRRLQTMVQKRGLARSIHQARQLIVHGHIAIGNQVINAPSYLVRRGEDSQISFAPFSPLSSTKHAYHESILQKEKAPPKPRQFDRDRRSDRPRRCRRGGALLSWPSCLSA